ncbi:MAG: FHA domain-containing serine/threonine-protein kinase [Planctomycetota bacterium]|nr:FHA domain-containing serine/threonine-protein kinase [Planctomycetota bacterium]
MVEEQSLDISLPWLQGRLREKLKTELDWQNWCRDFSVVKSPGRGFIDQNGGCWVAYDPRVLTVYEATIVEFKLARPKLATGRFLLCHSMLAVILDRYFGPPQQNRPIKLESRSMKYFKDFCAFEQALGDATSLRQLLLVVCSELIFGFEGLSNKWEASGKLSFLRFQLAATPENLHDYPERPIFREFMKRLRIFAEKAKTMSGSQVHEDWLVRLLTGEHAPNLPTTRTHLYKSDLFTNNPIGAAATRLYDRLKLRKVDKKRSKTDFLRVPKSALRAAQKSERRAAQAALKDSDYNRPRLIGGYSIVKKLGAGAVGKVYLGIHKYKRYALKVLKPTVAEQLKDVSRFGREVEITLALKHPHIATTYKYGIDKGKPFLVMEYLPGGNMGELIELKKTLSERKTWSIIRQIALALDYAWNHPKQFVHRDIKAANIMFDGQGLAKLSDFGLATGSTEEATRFTSTGESMGTPVYMSPEALEDSSKIDVRSDLWSLGVLAFYAITGTLPFPAKSFAKLLLQIFSINPAELPLFQKIDPGSQQIISKLLAKKPADRYQTPLELVTAIDERPFLIHPRFPAKPMPCPFVLAFPNGRKLFVFHDSELRFGRNIVSGVQLCLRPLPKPKDDSYRRMSSEHGRFVFNPDGFTVVDASSNGLYVNDRLLGRGQSQRLESGDTIRLAEVMNLFVHPFPGGLLLTREDWPQHAYLWLRSAVNLSDCSEFLESWSSLTGALIWRDQALFLIPESDIMIEGQTAKDDKAIGLRPGLSWTAEDSIVTIYQSKPEMHIQP